MKIETQQIRSLIKQSRIQQGYTQQQVANMAKLSLRSIQRIEKGEVIPSQYSLDMLAKELKFDSISVDKKLVSGKVQIKNDEQVGKAQKLILSVGSGLILILLTTAFIAQSPRFPETHFEALLLWTGVTTIYFFLLWKMWK